MGLLTPLGSAWRIRKWSWRGVSSQSMKSALELQGGDLSGEWPGKFLKFPEAVWSVCEECWLQQLEPLVVQQGPSMGLVALSHVSFILGQLCSVPAPPINIIIISGFLWPHTHSVVRQSLEGPGASFWAVSSSRGHREHITSSSGIV